MEDQQSLPECVHQYRVNNKRWVSDLDFFKIEMVFLQRLVNEHFNNLIRYSHIEILKYIYTQLIKINKEINQLSDLLSEQIIKLESIKAKNATVDIKELALTQARLDLQVNTLIKTYRGIKMELFTVVEDVIHENQFLIN
ncbi:MAG: hypothetical protein ACXVAY_10765 [Mucilaginibacter sp.]